MCQKRPAMSYEPRGLGIDEEDAQVISKREHTHAAAIAAKRR